MKKAKDIQIDIEKLAIELVPVKGNDQNMEDNKMILETQSKKLEVKLAKVKNSNWAEAATINLKSEVDNYGEQLTAEAQERRTRFTTRNQEMGEIMYDMEIKIK